VVREYRAALLVPGTRTAPIARTLTCSRCGSAPGSLSRRLSTPICCRLSRPRCSGRWPTRKAPEPEEEQPAARGGLGGAGMPRPARASTARPASTGPVSPRQVSPARAATPGRRATGPWRGRRARAAVAVSVPAGWELSTSRAQLTRARKRRPRRPSPRCACPCSLISRPAPRGASERAA
jgi:hypothetical protein